MKVNFVQVRFNLTLTFSLVIFTVSVLKDSVIMIAGAGYLTLCDFTGKSLTVLTCEKF